MARSLTREEAEQFVARMDARASRNTQRNLLQIFPDEGPLSWKHYKKHIEFFGAGRWYMERCFMAGNRVGKTYSGGYELSCHLTGWYPHWWPGRYFRRSIKTVAAGRTSKNTRDILQKKLLGKVVTRNGRKALDGTGMIPGEWIGPPAMAEGIRDLIDTVPIKNFHGGWSELQFKSFEQGPGAFEGTEKDVILLDEEPPMDVYGEALMRLTSTTGRFEDNGLMMLTFTPLMGYSDVVMQFIPENMRPTAPASFTPSTELDGE